MRDHEALAAAAFGRLWLGERSDPQRLAALVAFVKRHGVGVFTEDAAGADAAVLRAGIAAWEALDAATDLDVAVAASDRPDELRLALRGYTGAGPGQSRRQP